MYAMVQMQCVALTGYKFISVSYFLLHYFISIYIYIYIYIKLAEIILLYTKGAILKKLTFNIYLDKYSFSLDTDTHLAIQNVFESFSK